MTDTTMIDRLKQFVESEMRSCSMDIGGITPLYVYNMITIQDLYNIVGNKIANEAQKALIRNNFPPQIAEQMCNAIDGQERAEHFQRLLREYNEWMQNQQRQQEAVQRFLREYYK